MATWSYQGENQEHSSTDGQRPWVNKGAMLGEGEREEEGDWT